jgi:hypothetical protein
MAQKQIAPTTKIIRTPIKTESMAAPFAGTEMGFGRHDLCRLSHQCTAAMYAGRNAPAPHAPLICFPDPTTRSLSITSSSNGSFENQYWGRGSQIALI